MQLLWEDRVDQLEVDGAGHVTGSPFPTETPSKIPPAVISLILSAWFCHVIICLFNQKIAFTFAFVILCLSFDAFAHAMLYTTNTRFTLCYPF
jgi:hypothetical protein